MNKERSTVLCKKFDEFFEKKDYVGLLSYIQNVSQDQIIAESWEVIPDLCNNLNLSDEVNLTCKNILHHLALRSDAIAMFQLLNEEIRKSMSNKIFCVILDIIPKTFLRIMEPKKEYYDKITSTIYKYIETISAPHEACFDIEKYKDNEKYLQLGVVLVSVALFIEEVLKNERSSNSIISHINIINTDLVIFINFILNIFESPLSNINISLKNCYKCQGFDQCSTHCVNTNDLSEIHKATKLLANLINEMKPDTLKLLLDLQNRNNSIGLSILVYLVYSEDIKSAKYPCIYSHQFVFETCSKYILILLEGKKCEHTNKGLSIFCRLLAKLQANTWNIEFLEWPTLKLLMQHVVIVAANTELAIQREQSLRIIATVVEAFTPCSVRCSLLRMLLLKSPEKVVMSHIITLVKKEIDQRFERLQRLNVILLKDLEEKKLLKEEDQLNGEHTLLANSDEEGEMFEKLLSLIFSLPGGEKSNLFACSERIIGALNLLKYLLDKDKIGMNYSKIWTLMPHIEEKYIPILGRIIEYTKAQCELEKKNFREAVSRIRLEIKELIIFQPNYKDVNNIPIEICDNIQNNEISNSPCKHQIGDQAKCPAPITSTGTIIENKKNELQKYEKELILLEKSFKVIDGIEVMRTDVLNFKLGLKI